MKIEFGCGETPSKKDFRTCDVRNLPGVDFVCPAWQIDKFVGEESVDEIFSRHFFEHLTFAQGRMVLRTWHKILKPGGKMHMILPNMTFHIEQWIRRKNNKELRWAEAGFWGWQREGDTEMWDVHKSGYDFETLHQVLTKQKFIKIRNLTSPINDKHLTIECLK